LRVIYLGLSINDTVGGIQNYSKIFLKALEVNNIDYKAYILHDKKPLGNDNSYCFKGNKLNFLIKVLLTVKTSDIVIWNHISLGILYFLFKPIIRSKNNILIVYGTEVWNKNLSSIKIKSLKTFDSIWSISSYTKNRLNSIHNINKEKFSILPCCLDKDSKKGYKNPFNKEKINILTISRLDLEPKINATYRVLDVMPILIMQGFNVHLSIIGSGSEVCKLKKHATKLAINQHVDFLGYVDDTRPYLEHCDIFSLLSEHEGFGIVYLEAMQYSKCCLSAKDCGSEDVIVNDVNGYAVNIQDLNDLENKFTRLCKKQDLREKMGNNGLNIFNKKFTFNKVAKIQMELLQNVREQEILIPRYKF